HKNNHSVYLTTQKILQKECATLSRMDATTIRRSQNLQAVLETKSILITFERTNQKINND
ncbi:19224_t:CDS:1, partial [Cetraspora pellucida]